MLTITIYYDEETQETIHNVRGIAGENDTGNLIIWYTENGENRFLNIRYVDYVRVVIL